MSISAIHEFAKMASADEVMWHEENIKTAGVAELKQKASEQLERARRRFQRSKGHLTAAGKALMEDEAPSILSRAAKGLREHKGKAALGLGAAAAGGAYLHHKTKLEASKMASATRVLNVYEYAEKEAGLRDLVVRAKGQLNDAVEEAGRRGRALAEQAERHLRASEVRPLSEADASGVQHAVSQAIEHAEPAAEAVRASGGKGGSFPRIHGRHIALGGGLAALGGAGYLAARRRAAGREG